MEEEKNWTDTAAIIEDDTQVGQKKIVSITEAARINNVTRQAIYVAIKQKKLKVIL